MPFLRRASPGQERRRLGRRGEKYAGRWLKRKGFRILQRNFRLGDDEADIIALDPDGGTIVIVEVKTRSDAKIPPASSINAKKQYRMARLASRMQKSGPYANHPLRLDVITIHWPPGGDPELTYYANAFESPI